MSKEADLRRANEELTSAYRQLEAQHQKLREQNQLLREQLKKHAGPVAVKPPAPRTDDVPGPDSIVDYVDSGGHEHWAVVKKVLPNGMLRLKVFRRAVPNLVLDVPRAQSEGQRCCWRPRRT